MRKTLYDEHEGSTFVRHIPCDTCGSRDNNGLFSDGHTFCFGCSAYKAAVDSDSLTITPERRKQILELITGEPEALVGRKITQATCSHFGYLKGKYDGKTVQIAPYYNADGQLVAQKIRFANKDFKFLGDSKEVMPFGYHAFPKSGKMLVLTEGEIDALAMSQVQGNQWPVWSISCGADNPTDKEGNPLPMTKIRKYIARIREYLLAFDKVVIMFDSDAPGRASAKVAAEVLGPKACIAELPQGFKDAGEMLQQGKTKELLDAMWRAKPYRPEGIVDLASLKEATRERPRMGLSYPFETLTKLTYGIRRGELIALGAGTGIGKTDLFTQIMEWLVREHNEKIGVFSLEQKVTQTALRLVGKFAKLPLHIPDVWDDDVFDTAWDTLVKERQVFLYDSFGRNEWDSVKEKIEYLHHAEGVNYFFLDHLTAFTAGADDERQLLDGIMEEMSSLATRLDVTIFFISHLATPEGKPHEEGGRVMGKHFRGSRAIQFWSHFMFGMERDTQAEDLDVRQTTTVRFVKDRYTGRATGEVFYLRYDRETGMLYECPPPNEGQRHGFRDETEAPSGAPSDF